MKTPSQCRSIQPVVPGLHLLWIRRNYPVAGTEQDLRARYHRENPGWISSPLIALLQQELFDIRGETAVINRELDDVREQTSSTKLRLARLHGDLSTVQGQYAATQRESESTFDEGDLRRNEAAAHR